MSAKQMPIKVDLSPEALIDTLFPAEPMYKELSFTRYAWTKMLTYAHLIGKYEITGFGRVIDNQVVDVKILRQKVKEATVDCDVDAMMDFLMNIPPDQHGQWTLDWHSHVDMGAFASGTDTANYKEQFTARLKKQFPYIIINKRQECYCKCYVNPTTSTDIKVTIEPSSLTKDEFLGIYNECKEDIENLCSKTSYIYTGKTSVKGYYGNYNYYSDDADDDEYASYYSSYFGAGTKKSDVTKLSTTHHGESCTKKNADDDYAEEVVKDMQELDERAYQQALDFKNNADLDDFCESCGVYLKTAMEYDRGLCDDCWSKLTPDEKVEWCKKRLDN